MKRAAIFLISLSFSGILMACGDYSDLIPKWRLGVIAGGYYHNPHMGSQAHFLPGIQLNRKIGSIELRLGAEHTRYNGPATFQPDYFWHSGYSNRTLVRAGIEKGKTWGRFTVYGAADLAFHYTHSEFESTGCFGPIGVTDSKSTGGGIIPSLGMRYQLTSKLSCFAEYRAEAFISDVQEKITYYSGNIDTRPYNYTQFDFNFGAIGHAGIAVAF